LAELKEDPEDPPFPFTLPEGTTIDDLFESSGLSVMGPDYTPVSWRDARGPLDDAISEDGEITLETVGSLADGRSVWWRKS
jgi:hypothetical protein